MICIFLIEDFLILRNNCIIIRLLFKIQITQIKKENNSCLIKGWWQDELVAEYTYSCSKSFESEFNLYIAGQYSGNVVNGQVRNFSYTKK